MVLRTVHDSYGYHFGKCLSALFSSLLGAHFSAAVDEGGIVHFRNETVTEVLWEFTPLKLKPYIEGEFFLSVNRNVLAAVVGLFLLIYGISVIFCCFRVKVCYDWSLAPIYPRVH